MSYIWSISTHDSLKRLTVHHHCNLSSICSTCCRWQLILGCILFRHQLGFQCCRMRPRQVTNQDGGFKVFNVKHHVTKGLMNACKFDDPSHELWTGTSRGHVLPDFFIVRSEWLTSKFCVAMLQNHELWPLFQIGDRHFHHSPGSISVCIGEVEILDFSQLGHLGAWSRRKAMKRPHVTTGHWLEVPNMTSPNLWTLEMTPAFVVCCRSLKDEAWRQWCTILYTRSKTVDGRIPKQPPAMYNNEINYQAQLVNRISAINSIMPSFTYSYSTSSPLEWRILENHVDFQEVRVAKYCWCSCSEAPFVFKSMWNRNPSKRSASADVQPKINATEIGP